MRRRLPGILVLLVLAGGVFLLVRSSGGDPPPRYTIELDNAYGLTEGAEIRVANVRVGAITKTRVDKRTARALVDVEIERKDFGDLRADATCSVEPQSLIGEYLMECDPGRSPKRQPVGSTIPVSRTTGTIPPDLVLDVMRRPAREQFGLIFAELGAGFAGRGDDLRDVIRRAVPALRETDRVLTILGDKSQTLRALTRDADTVMGRLSGNRRDVGRFVREARDTAAISARRRSELAESIRRLPGFLRELRPTLGELETVATRQTPALRDLRLSADDLERLLRRLGPFAGAAGPAIDALGKASVAGTRAVRPARETVRRAGRLGELAKEPATNLRFVGEHLDDRKFATEKSAVSPGGLGFTGLEAFLRYLYTQSQAINIFDSRGYSLKIELLINECTGFTNGETARRDTARQERCKQYLGPNQPGVNQPDPSPPTPAAARRAGDAAIARRGAAEAARGGAVGDGAPSGDAAPAPRGDGDRARRPAPPRLPAVPGVPAVPSVPTPSTPAAPERGVQGLLDYLLGA